MHVAAHDPSPVSIDRTGVPKALLEKETEILRRQAASEGKPPQVTERIVEGRLKKFYGEVCLLEQAFVKNPDQSVAQLLEEAGKKLGQPVRVAGFVRFKLGETATE
jgi:elongation factor Ts